ncbi:MAG: hypothetical protein OXP74_00175 [Acidobacteriota bacterium]|nr:hypothetical protein [Acidobacteriota bacterium]
MKREAKIAAAAAVAGAVLIACGPTSNGAGDGDWPMYRGDAAGAPPRIVFCAGTRLIALDAATGAPVTEFGDGGTVDIGVPYNSVPLV